MLEARSQWLRGVTDLLVLAMLRSGRNYGYALVEELGRVGLTEISEATVYGALRRLDRSGLTVSALVASDAGPARRYYELTPAGREHLAVLRDAWGGFETAVGLVIEESS